MRSFIAALALVASGTAASAADLGLPPPPPDYAVPAPIGCCTTGWYFKGYLGTTNYQVQSLDSTAFDAGNFSHIDKAFESSGFAGIGVGYKFNNWLRFDTTGEYRGKATFHGLDTYKGGVNFPGGTDEYTATLKSWVWLANAYWDIGCWGGFTPYVGGGVGYAQNYIGDFTDINTPNNGVAFANTNITGNFAWAVHAGVAYQVTPRFTVDLAYRYLNLGDMSSDKIQTYNGSGTFPELEFQNVASHDVMLGFRWNFGGGGAAPMPVAFK
jgi:opacity protein-like surface antigen